MRVPARLLPLALRAVRFARTKLLWRIGDALSDIESDLASLVEPETVDNLVSWDSLMDQHERRFAEEWWESGRNIVVRPRVCFQCGTTDPDGYCTTCQVLNTGRLPS